MALLLGNWRVPDEFLENIFVVSHKFAVMCRVRNEKSVEHITNSIHYVDHSNRDVDCSRVELWTELEGKPVLQLVTLEAARSVSESRSLLA